ncbi:large conductance mechanosensitive channel protein [Zalerion maritima]|uniref:Large conductance mechanosensitive channel protein n=1 Tax=Zalerion maritima TaxID=339359 RepID=A0AAD5RQM6_9PEZI|nr:large conductance mechanosensitive channel protein [Zalerion maritima]
MRFFSRVKNPVQPAAPRMPGMTADGDSDGDGYDSGDERSSLLATGRRKAYRLWDGFTDFAFQGNILELAFGLILASAFTTLVTSFVSDILMPPLSVVFPLDRNMGEKFAVLKAGPSRPDAGYTTLGRAQDDGAVVWSYGSFLDKLANFLFMGAALYGLALAYQGVSRDDIIKKTVKCKYCRKRVNARSRRCVNCTSWLDGRDDLPSERERNDGGIGNGGGSGGEGSGTGTGAPAAAGGSS